MAGVLLGVLGMPIRWITDMGQATELHCNGEVSLIPRYGVWEKGFKKAEVIETSDNLAELMQKHGVPEDRVVLMRRVVG